MARLLLDRGYRNVAPLEGGFAAWLAAGFPAEPLDDSEVPLHAAVSRRGQA